MKICPTSLEMKEMQFKSARRYHFSPIRKQKDSDSVGCYLPQKKKKGISFYSLVPNYPQKHV